MSGITAGSASAGALPIDLDALTIETIRAGALDGRTHLLRGLRLERRHEGVADGGRHRLGEFLPLAHKLRDEIEQQVPIIAASRVNDPVQAEAAIERGEADLVAFGRPYLSNPDLVERFRLNAPLNPGDEATFHNGGAKGYVDYPTLAEARAAE